MSRPLIPLVACALLAFTLGVCAWLAWPTGRSFSYFNDLRPLYLIEQRLTVETLRERRPPPDDLGAVMAQLMAEVGPAGTVYATLGTLSGGQLTWQGQHVNSPGIVFALGGYPEARDLRLIAGRHPRLNAAEVVLSEPVARQLSADPTRLIGQSVVLDPQGIAEAFTVSGVVAASFWRSEEDPDTGGFRLVDPSAPGLDEDTRRSLRFASLRLLIQFARTPAPDMLDRVAATVAARLPGYRFYDLKAHEAQDPSRQAIAARLSSRARALPLLSALLMVSGLLSLTALRLAHLLRQRALLGVDRALGAPSRRLLGEALLAQVVPAVIGAVIGAGALFALPSALPGVLRGAPPGGVLLLALSLPPVALGLLTFALVRRVLVDPALTLLRAPPPGAYVRPLLGLLLVAFSLAAGGLLSALGVKERLDAQATRVRSEFGRLLQWSSSGDPDVRKGPAGGFTSRSLGSADVTWLERQPEVRRASVAERLGPSFRVAGRAVTLARPVVGDALIETLGLTLHSGQPGGCLLTESQARTQRIALGSVLTLPGPAPTQTCAVSGLLADPDPLQTFVLDAFPGAVIPVNIGLPGRQGDQPRTQGVAGELLSTDIVFALNRDASPALLTELRERLAARRPDLKFSLRPYAPSIDALLAQLQRQSRLFLGLAGIGTALTLLGLLGGFLAYLDASRYRLALERSQGLTLRALTRQWTAGGLSLGLLGSGIGLLIATALTPALYNAFSLDAPVSMALNLLPEARPALPGVWTLGAALVLSTLFTGLLVVLSLNWLRRQSLITLLKAGS